MISLINAGPGTGKTYTLIHGYQTLANKLISPVPATEEQQEVFDYLCENFKPNTRVMFFAHSKSVKEHLIARLGKQGPKVNTFHGAGLSCIIKRWGYQGPPCNNRTEEHIKQLTGMAISDMEWEEKKKWYAIKRLLHYHKIESMTPSQENLYYLTNKYADLSSYTIPDDWEDLVADLLDMAAKPDRKIEYADMVWLGKKAIRSPICDLGLVDESQDVSKSTYELVTRMCKHVLFCGDKNQAINAFAGASEDMYEHIRTRSDAVLPLKVTQRCPPIICKLANKTRPGGIIEGPNQAQGEIADVSLSSLPGKLVGAVNPQTCLFVSRTNAAIINLAIYFHSKQLPYQIIDKELSTELNNFVKSLKATSLNNLKYKLDGWMAKMNGAKNPLWIQMCKDKYDCLSAIIAQCKDLTHVTRFIKEAFEKHKKGFKLTTVHKAKGLEAENIFIVNPPIPLPLAMNHPIGREQEINLQFVAETRSSLNLYYVR
jgi:superfamily I DNA/RNA helicase